MRLLLEKEGVPKKRYFSASFLFQSQRIRNKSVVDDLNGVEDKLRERFGDFTPFLDDDDDELIGELEKEEEVKRGEIVAVAF
jgi:hypothetical protein